jgi:hypothetical protein
MYRLISVSRCLQAHRRLCATGDPAAIMTAASEGEETSTIIAMGTGVLDRFGAGGLEASRRRS